MARLRTSHAPNNSHSSPAKTVKIPLNDDDAEKAKRLKERSLLQDIQKQKMRAIASPARRQTLGGADGSPKTPGRGAGEVLDAVTPLRKVPILANFEEWMKLATDNKINATNSWNFALIDYFHDMSLLKEGDGVNFQKASCTLDGCVKIYTSRVDSVATETGKLLSGLAESKQKKGRGDGDAEGDGAGGSDAEDGEDGEGRKKKKREKRSSEATLAKDFNQLRIKKFELEFSVDPLFKKASADFDEGGAKGLLLNHLSIDHNGRIVFDSSDDRDENASEVKATEDKEGADGDEDEEETEEDAEPRSQREEREPKGPDEAPDDPATIHRNIMALKERFLPNLDILDEQDVCPSLKNFDLGDPTATLDMSFLKNLEDKEEDAPNNHNINNKDADGDQTMGGPGMAFGFDDGFGVGLDDDGNDDMVVGFGEGGEAWAHETLADAADRLLSPSKRPLMGMSGGDQGAEPETGLGDYSFGLTGYHEDILGYFDDALKKNWAGPEHWRIRRIKDNSKPTTAAPRQRREKETFEIDFMNPAADVTPEMLAPPKSLSTLNMPKKDRVSKTRHLLPDDKHFNSKQLLRLFLKPRVSLSGRKRTRGGKAQLEEPENVDEEFWARENMARELQASSTPDGAAKGNYDANFFNDDNDNQMDLPLPDVEDDDDIFADAREMFSPAPENGAPLLGAQDEPISTQAAAQAGPFGSQLVTSGRRVRPEYVQYARVAKKVDVRKLKENIWSGLAFDTSPPPEPDTEAQQQQQQQQQKQTLALEESKKFTQVINDLRRVYPEKAMSDISTSYCFICLLHLANEKGLVVEEVGDGLDELLVKKDPTAGEQDAF